MGPDVDDPALPVVLPPLADVTLEVWPPALPLPVKSQSLAVGPIWLSPQRPLTTGVAVGAGDTDAGESELGGGSSADAAVGGTKVSAATRVLRTTKRRKGSEVQFDRADIHHMRRPNTSGCTDLRLVVDPVASGLPTAVRRWSELWQY